MRADQMSVRRTDGGAAAHRLMDDAERRTERQADVKSVRGASTNIDKTTM